MVMQDEVTIDGVDVTQYRINWTHIEEWKVSIDILTINLYQNVRNIVDPIFGMSVLVTRGFTLPDDEVVFVGSISQVKPEKGANITLICKGELFEAVKASRKKSWDRNIDTEAGVGSEIFKSLCANSGLAYSSTSVPTTGTSEDTIINKLIQNDETNYDIMVDLADRYSRVITYDKDNLLVEFLPKGFRTYGTALNVGTEIPGQIDWKENGEQLVNYVKVYGATAIDKRVQTFTGPATEFELTNVPEDTEVRQGDADGTLYSRGQLNVGTLGTDFDYYVDEENKKVVFASNKSNIWVRYGAKVPQPVVLWNKTSIETYGGPNRTPTKKRLDFTDIKDVRDAENRGRAYLNRYSTPFNEGQNVPVSNDTISTYGTIRPGTVLRINDTYANKYLDVFVHSVEKSFPHITDKINFGDEIWRTEDWNANLAKKVDKLFKELNKNEEILISIFGVDRSIDYERRHAYLEKRDMSSAGDSVFLLSSPLFGILGTSKYGDSSGLTFSISKIVQGNNLYREYLYDDFYEDPASDANIDTLNMEINLLLSGDTWISKPIHIGDSKSSASIKVFFDKAITFEITADGDSGTPTWDTVSLTSGVESTVNFTVPGSYVMYRITSTLNDTTISTQVDADTEEREYPAITIDLG